ncbi:hypothetical protein M407DRAFT_213134 [Tulasnella calospora MUT 4182]|uniref:Uncharacterized protein n=1 Tax=Tulasnella calospora MUT 4182 TaxID=1051891 RepID=A0A0C3QEI6_9AGAM|nr:hypothetical protein M407DRAFT_213134 [Tulasnella calospora MUT 4182]
MASSHSRRISIETFSRAGLNGGLVVNLAEEQASSSRRPSFDALVRAKEEHRSHNRNLSVVSTISTATESSTHTRRSSVSSDPGTFIHREEENVPGCQEGIISSFAATNSPHIPGKTTVKHLKAAFRRSLGLGAKALASEIVVKKHGIIDQDALEDALLGHTAPLSEVTSFKITSSHSYIGYNQLVETLDYLSHTLPALQEIILYSQVYTLEELNNLSPYLSRFAQLRSFAVLDIRDDPPEVCPTLCKIITLWALARPTLQRVQFIAESWWEPTAPHEAQNDAPRTTEWIECSSTLLR